MIQALAISKASFRTCSAHASRLQHVNYSVDRGCWTNLILITQTRMLCRPWKASRTSHSHGWAIAIATQLRQYCDRRIMAILAERIVASCSLDKHVHNSDSVVREASRHFISSCIPRNLKYAPSASVCLHQTAISHRPVNNPNPRRVYHTTDIALS